MEWYRGLRIFYLEHHVEATTAGNIAERHEADVTDTVPRQDGGAAGPRMLLEEKKGRRSLASGVRWSAAHTPVCVNVDRTAAHPIAEPQPVDFDADTGILGSLESVDAPGRKELLFFFPRRQRIKLNVVDIF